MPPPGRSRRTAGRARYGDGASVDDVPTSQRRAARRRLGLLALALAACFALAAVLLPHDAGALASLAQLPVPLLAAGAIAAWTLLTPVMVSGTLLAAATG